MEISPPNIGFFYGDMGILPSSNYLNGAFQQAMELITQWVSNSKNDEKKPLEESGLKQET